VVSIISQALSAGMVTEGIECLRRVEQSVAEATEAAAGGALRTSTLPTLNILLLLRESV
jgi:hypothetical protein